MIGPHFVPLAVPGFVLDISVPAVWLLVRRATLYTDRVLRRMPSAVAAVPSNWPSDLAGHLTVAESRGEVTQPQVTRFLSALASFRIYVDDETPFRVFDDILPLVRAHNLSTNDAAYLELALRLNLPLATTDPALTRAANAAGGSVFTP